MYINEKGQAVAGPVVKMSEKDFASQDQTSIYWMGSASIYIQSHGTKIMIDPLLEGFDMPLLFEMPILPQDVPSLDGVLITHIDNDHFSRMTCIDLKGVCKSYHAPHYVASVMNEETIPGVGHDIGESFKIGSIDVTLTKAVHNWQNGSKNINIVLD